MVDVEEIILEQLKELREEVKELRSEISTIKELLAFRKGSVAIIAVIASGVFTGLIQLAIAFFKG